MRKKVLVCAYSCVSESGVKNIGGEAELGINMVKQLSRFFDVSVLTHYHNKKAIEEILTKEPLQNVKFFYIALPTFFSFLENWHKGGIQIYSYLWQIKAYFFAKNLHKEANFDVFHHITYANDWMASYIGALLKVPYIRGPGGGAHSVPKAFLKNYSFKDKLAEKTRSLGQWVFRHDPFFIIGQNRAKALLVCNQEAFNAMPKKWQKKAQFFPVNGITQKDLDLLPKNNNINERFLIISAGKLIKIKSVDLAIMAFKKFNDLVPASEFLIVGDGPEFLSLQKLVADLGLQKNVIFRKWMLREELMRQMAESDLFVFTSLRDGGGAVVVEAMAMQKPVVCFDISGPGFHVNDECGIKIKPTSPSESIKDISIAFKTLYDNKELRLAMGQNARKRAQEYYDWDKLGDTLYKIYEDVF